MFLKNKASHCPSERFRSGLSLDPKPKKMTTRSILLETSNIPSKINTTIKELKTGFLTEKLLSSFSTLNDEDKVTVVIVALKVNANTESPKTSADQG